MTDYVNSGCSLYDNCPSHCSVFGFTALSTAGTAEPGSLCRLRGPVGQTRSSFHLAYTVYEHEKHKTDFNTANKSGDLTVPGVI